MLEIRAARFPDELETVRGLFRDYARLLGEDLCFQGFKAELAGLPGAYGPPRGVLLLGLAEGRPRGCVALRDQGGGTCEMKRLFVEPGARGLGLGRRLCGEVIARARGLGFRDMRLDTLERLREALALYAALGFKPIPPYYANPLPNVVYLALEL